MAAGSTGLHELPEANALLPQNPYLASCRDHDKAPEFPPHRNPHGSLRSLFLSDQKASSKKVKGICQRP